MTSHSGTVNQLDRDHTTNKGKACVLLNVGGYKYYIFTDVVPEGLRVGDDVDIEYTMGKDGKFRLVDSITITGEATPEKKAAAEAAQQKEESQQETRGASDKDKELVYMRQTALNCASQLIAGKVFKTVTGEEGVCCLANKFVEYLRTGKVPDVVKEK